MSQDRIFVEQGYQHSRKLCDIRRLLVPGDGNGPDLVYHPPLPPLRPTKTSRAALHGRDSRAKITLPIAIATPRRSMRDSRSLPATIANPPVAHRRSLPPSPSPDAPCCSPLVTACCSLSVTAVFSLLRGACVRAPRRQGRGLWWHGGRGARGGPMDSSSQWTRLGFPDAA